MVVWTSMRSRNDVVNDAKAVTSIESLVRACMVRRIPSVPPGSWSGTSLVGYRWWRMRILSPPWLTFS